MSLMQPCIQPSAKPCPICRVSMLGSGTGLAPREFDHFECLNCGVVMDFSRSQNQRTKFVPSCSGTWLRHEARVGLEVMGFQALYLALCCT